MAIHWTTKNFNPCYSVRLFLGQALAIKANWPTDLISWLWQVATGRDRLWQAKTGYDRLRQVMTGRDRLWQAAKGCDRLWLVLVDLPEVCGALNLSYWLHESIPCQDVYISSRVAICHTAQLIHFLWADIMWCATNRQLKHICTSGGLRQGYINSLLKSVTPFAHSYRLKIHLPVS